MWPHRRQPTRLPRPWDSPGKNTGVGCHFLLQCMEVKSESESEVAQLCRTLRDPMDCSLPGSSVHGTFQAEVLEWSAIAFSDNNCYTSAIEPILMSEIIFNTHIFRFCPLLCKLNHLARIIYRSNDFVARLQRLLFSTLQNCLWRNKHWK